MYLYAQTALSAVGVPQANPIGGFIPLILIFVVFYFLLIRPQQKKDKEHKKLLAALKKDDYVLTSGGIFGTVVNVQPEVVDLRIDDSTKIKIAKSAVIQVMNQTPEIVK